jgi:hypothetical protein
MLVVQFDNVKELLARFFLGVHYDNGPVPNWREQCIGITSWVHTDKHMPMLEYDGRSVTKLIRKEVKEFQEKLGLGVAKIYKTKRGAHIYFPTDAVDWMVYKQILTESKCCKGFREMALAKQHGVLRVSAKYTHFDIELMESIPAKGQGPRRPHIVGITAARLIEMGQECGTHIASLYPQWAKYQEDQVPWKPMSKKKLEAKAIPYQMASPGGAIPEMPASPAMDGPIVPQGLNCIEYVKYIDKKKAIAASYNHFKSVPYQKAQAVQMPMEVNNPPLQKVPVHAPMHTGAPSNMIYNTGPSTWSNNTYVITGDVDMWSTVVFTAEADGPPTAKVVKPIPSKKKQG